MICALCAKGADTLHYTLTHKIGHDLAKQLHITSTTMTARRRVQASNDLHGRCRGGTWCDCQCVGTPNEARKKVAQ